MNADFFRLSILSIKRTKTMLKTMGNNTLMPEETIASKILLIRGEKLILDSMSFT